VYPVTTTSAPLPNRLASAPLLLVKKSASIMLVFFGMQPIIYGRTCFLTESCYELSFCRVDHCPTAAECRDQFLSRYRAHPRDIVENAMGSGLSLERTVVADSETV